MVFIERLLMVLRLSPLANRDGPGIGAAFEMLNLHGVDAAALMRSLHRDQSKTAFPAAAAGR